MGIALGITGMTLLVFLACHANKPARLVRTDNVNLQFLTTTQVVGELEPCG